MEECAKIEVLGASAAGLFIGHKVDLDKMSEVFRSHAQKNRVNAHFLEPSTTEKSARKDGEVDSALAAFRKAQDECHVRSNEEKNSALYVDIEKGEFVSPAEKVTSRMLARFGEIERETFTVGRAEGGDAAQMGQRTKRL